ncbi:hypothetical protein OSB04_006997 [Centaurea solstitialis]|uniref:Reverse transcriptase n=1 Tax=Centaurea solstitialis TaxID=347529 RepID=A0AA38U2A3_9ASTR|nr:hypothetical protein OSB04_006997 [Centaurea solstitialis]
MSVQHNFSSTYRWLEREDHSGSRRYVTGVCARFWRKLGFHLLLVEFSYNNSFHASIGMPPYEMLYERRCRTLICWGKVKQRELGSTMLNFNDVMFPVTEKKEREGDEKEKARRKQLGLKSINWVGEYANCVRGSDLESKFGDLSSNF